MKGLARPGILSNARMNVSDAPLPVLSTEMWGMIVGFVDISYVIKPEEIKRITQKKYEKIKTLVVKVV